MQMPPTSSPSNYPRENVGGDRGALHEIAVAQRNVMVCVAAQIATAVMSSVGRNLGMGVVSFVAGLLAFAMFVFSIVSAVKLTKALGLSPILYVILMFIPCVSLITLLVLSGKATSRLQLAGVKVGLLGANPETI
jgi:hypothetical protein